MIRVLLVEDEALLAMGLALSLEAMGFEVRTMPDGQQALEALDGGFMPDVIVTDCMMPIMDGPTFTATIRQRQEYESVPILMYSGVPEEKLPAPAKYDAYMQKPVSDERLVEVVKELLEGRQQTAVRA